jgi:hypothetical protein
MTDPIPALAGEIARATVQQTVDRAALREAAHAVAHGPERLAARVGYAIATGVLEELRTLPPASPRVDLNTLFDNPRKEIEK